MPKHLPLHRKAVRPLSRERLSQANDSDPVQFSTICIEGRKNAAAAYTVKPNIDVVIEIDFSKEPSSTGLNILSSAMKGLKNNLNSETAMDREISDVFNFAVNYYEDTEVFSNIQQILAIRDWYSQISQHAALSIKEKADEKNHLVKEVETSLLNLIKKVKSKLTSAISNPDYKDVVESVVKTELFKSYESHHDSKKAPRATQKSDKPHDHSPHSHGFDPKVLRSPKIDRTPMHLPRNPNLHSAGKSNPGKGRGRSGGGK